MNRQEQTQSAPGLTAEKAASRSSANALFDLFENGPALVVELDTRGRIVRCNRGFSDASGYEPGELLDRFPPDFLACPPESSLAYPYLQREQWSCKHGNHRIVHWQKLWTFEHRRRTRYLKLGTCSGRGLHLAGGVEESRMQLQAFLDAAPDAIITIDDRGTIVSANPATESLFQYDRTELLGRNVSMLMPRPDRDRHDGYLSRYLATGEARIIGIGREIIARRKGGSTFPARLSVSEFKSHGQTYFTGMLHDITERVEAEERQRVMFAEHAHASRVVALGEMASSIAHEINQPLTAVVGFADASRKLIDTDRHDVDTLKHALRQISEQGQRAGAIIRRLREFVKKKEPNRSTTDVNELIESAARLTAHDADRYGIRLVFDLEPRMLTALVDRLQIEQVILNLIRNSIESINDDRKRDGEIRVCSRLEGDMFAVAVSDNGAGIKPSERSTVFNAFYSTKANGTGLGLSISNSIAEAHDGELNFAPNDGPGVTFTLKLPVHADA